MASSGVVSCEEAARQLQGQAEVWELMFAFADSLAVRCAVELRIPDIIRSHGSPTLSLSRIASHIASYDPMAAASSLDTASLSRVMRLLVRKKIFACTHGPSGEAFFGLTPSSRWLFHDSERTLVPMFIMETHPWLLAPWHQLSATIKEGGSTTAFERAHGCSLWEFGGKNPVLNNMFNSAMACTSKVVVEAILSVYKDGLQGVETLVDVGGGNGDLLAGIVKANWPRIKGINFDLQQVVQSAPLHQGVTHVGGDMFLSVPQADAIVMKWILHDWSDEDCLKILKNCKKAMSNTTPGKLILVEMVLQGEGEGEGEGEGKFSDTTMRFDLLMMAHCLGGRERSQLEWINLLKDAGFTRTTIINIPALPSIIEAYVSI